MKLVCLKLKLVSPYSGYLTRSVLQSTGLLQNAFVIDTSNIKL